MRAMASGQFAESHACLAEAAGLAAQAKDENARRCLAVHRHWLLLMQDDLAGLRAHEPEVIAALGSAMPELAVLARVAVLSRAGEFEALRAELPRGVRLSLPKLGAPIALMTLGEAVAPLGRTQHGRAVSEQLTPRADANGVWGLFGFVCFPHGGLSLGQLCAAEGDPARARAWYEVALARAQAMGASAHEAWVRLHLGRLLSEAPGGQAGRDDLERAGELAARLGMPGLAARALAALSPGAPAQTLPQATQDGFAFVLEREQDGWRVTRGARNAFVRDLRGMGMLAKLLARPGEELHALELAAGAGPEAVDGGDAGELLDDAARAAYQRRARRLRVALEEAEAGGDARAAAAAQTELEALARELARAQGLGGRSRRAGAAAERARVVVQRRVREAIRRLAQVDPELGAFLDAAVRTGTYCSYLPQRAAAAR
jgi:hypothetical protein